MSKWKISREDEAAMFTYSSLEKNKSLAKYMGSLRFESGDLVIGVDIDNIEEFLEDFGVCGYILERL